MESYLDHHNGGEHGHMSRWIDYCLYPPAGDPSVPFYSAQAVRPSELWATGEVAEAWDSPDIETAPNVDFNWPVWLMENLQPGWHAGPYNRSTNGLALLNGSRHPGSPNILYADGSVHADARRKVDPSELGPCPAGSWAGLQVNTWEDYDPAFGTLIHVVPKREFYK